MDVGTGLAAFGVAAGSAKVIEKILGPTSDYIGDNVRGWAERRIANVNNIFQKAEEKLGDKIEEEGTVPPKVLKEIFDEGSFCDDELGQEYFAGVLASSRTSVSRDDRGAAYAALTGRLTTYQIRGHYVLYRLFKQVYDGFPANFLTPNHINQVRIFVPYFSLLNAFDFSPGEKIDAIITHVFFGLDREKLIGDGFMYGNEEYMKGSFPEANGPGFLIRPVVPGVELFLWAHGKGNTKVERFLTPEFVCNPIPEIYIPDDAVATKPFVLPPD